MFPCLSLSICLCRSRNNLNKLTSSFFNSHSNSQHRYFGMASEAKTYAGKEELLAELDRLEIAHQTVEHPEVFTVEAMMPYLEDLPGVACKNLFLKDKKKKLWLLTTLHDRQISLGAIGKKVGAPSLRFADESVLVEKLGVTQGCVTPFAIVNDKAGDVKLLLDSNLANGGHEKVYAHPMVNTASTAVSSEDLVKFLKSTGHEPVLVDFDE